MSRLDEIKARAEQVHWTSTSVEQAMTRMASSAADVPWLVAQVDRLEAWRAEALGIIDYRGEQQRRAEDERDNALAEVARLTAERDALAAGRCMADTTLRDDEHRLVLCVLPEGHRTAHDDLLGTSWTDGTHYDPSEGSYDDWVHAQVVEVARAAEQAALRVAAERMEDLSRDDIPLTAAFAAGAAAKRLDQWADELTDTDDRSK